MPSNYGRRHALSRAGLGPAAGQRRLAELHKSVEDLESLEETLDVMDSPALLDDIREALSELGTASAPVMSKAEALSLIADR